MDPLAVLSGIGLVGAYWCTSELVMRDRTAVKIDEVSGSDNTTAVYGFKLPIRSSYLVQLQIALFQTLLLVFPFVETGALHLPVQIRIGFVVLQVYGVFLRYWSMKTLGSFFTRSIITRDNQKIIDQGPYAFVRHPGYAANLAVYYGGMVACAGNIFAVLLYIVLFFGIWGGRMDNEEAMLLKSFPEQYKNYRNKVRFRVVPFVY